MGMGMNHWEWERMELKKTFPLISIVRAAHRSPSHRSRDILNIALINVCYKVVTMTQSQWTVQSPTKNHMTSIDKNRPSQPLYWRSESRLRSHGTINRLFIQRGHGVIPLNVRCIYVISTTWQAYSQVQNVPRHNHTMDIVLLSHAACVIDKGPAQWSEAKPDYYRNLKM